MSEEKKTLLIVARTVEDAEKLVGDFNHHIVTCEDFQSLSMRSIRSLKTFSQVLLLIRGIVDTRTKNMLRAAEFRLLDLPEMAGKLYERTGSG